MARDDPPDAGADSFGSPDFPTLVGCLHGGQAYDSYRIEWRIEPDATGKPHGSWCCPISGCDGRGFGFDILPVDPEDADEHGGWVEDAEEEESLDEASPADEMPLEDGEELPGRAPWPRGARSESAMATFAEAAAGFLRRARRPRGARASATASTRLAAGAADRDAGGGRTGPRVR